MNTVKLKGGTKQTVTQVKGLSSVIVEVVEADILIDVEGNKWDSINGELSSLYRSLRPWYALKWNLHELGRSLSFRQRYDGTSPEKQGLSNEDREVGRVHSTRSMGKPCTWGRDSQERARSGSIYLINTQRKI